MPLELCSRTISNVAHKPLLTFLLAKVAKVNFQQIYNFLLNAEKRCESTDKEILFEWSHHGILSTNLNVQTTLQEFIMYSSSKRVKGNQSCRSFVKFPPV